MDLHRSINGLIVLTLLLSALLLSGFPAVPTRAAAGVNYGRSPTNICAVTDVVSFTVPAGNSSGGVASVYIHATSQTTQTWYVYLPLVMNSWPPQSKVYVVNNTGGQLCYEIYGTGIGQKCYSPGTYYYGAFAPGTYSWYASARCGSISGTRDYRSGIETRHTFWCSAGAAVHATTLLLEKETATPNVR